ncbi:MAG TPA: hypothetical protein V6C84_15700 [Coleofasciculaceae cyanobacterium]
MSTQSDSSNTERETVQPTVAQSAQEETATEVTELNSDELDSVSGGALSFRPALGITTTTAIPISTG